jgi:hypothetical protein
MVDLVLTDYGAAPDSGADATPAFRRAIEAARAAAGPVRLVVPAGRYDFFSTHAARRTAFYSNATEADSDGRRTIALDLSDLRDATVDGEGARLVMRGRMTMLAAERSGGLTLRGLEFDFARPPVSEITAVEAGSGHWIGEVHADSAYRIIDGRIEWYGEDWARGHNLVQHYDPATATVWRWDDPTSGATIREFGDRHLRFEGPGAVVVGRTYQFRDTERSETGMWFHRCRDVRLEDVRVRAMGGFGMLFQYTENVDVERVEVAPTAGRTSASAADILHFSGCRGQLRIRDCTLTAAHDDAINIHGTHLRIVGQPSRDQIRVRFMHPQTWGFPAFAAGDEIEFVRHDTLLPYATSHVKQAAMTDDLREQILTLAHPAPPDVRLDADVVENVTWTPAVDVTGCEIAKVPTRGILVTARRPVRILRNRFWRIPMPAILVEDDAAGWYESGPVHDLLIEGNEFFECGAETIRIEPQNRVHAGPVHRNVRIERNAFTLLALPAIAAKSVDGLSVVGNRFVTVRDESALLRTRDSTNVRSEANAVDTVR